MMWAYMLFYFGGFQLTGPFVTMIYKMLKGDLVRFGIIFLIFLFSFAQTFSILFKVESLDKVELFRIRT